MSLPASVNWNNRWASAYFPATTNAWCWPPAGQITTYLIHRCDYSSPAFEAIS